MPYQRWTRASLTASELAELVLVDALANQLRDHIDSTAEQLRVRHVHGASSQAIQEHFGHLLRDEPL
jgi:hypothetical protein